MLDFMIGLQESSVVDWTDCPLVIVDSRKLSGTPILVGTRMPADAIVENYAGGLSSGEITEIFEVPEGGVCALLAYAVAQRPSLRR